MKRLFSWSENDPDDTKDFKPNKDKNDSNPWGKKRNPNDGLPDLDEVFKQWQKWFKSLFNNKKTSGFGNRYGSDNNPPGGVFLGLAAALLVVIIGIVGFYKVEPGEEAIEYRFGKYIDRKGPGPHWLLPIIYSKEIHNTSVVHRADFEDDLITKEVNIVSVQLAVQYKIADLEKYLFKVRSPEDSLAEATRAAIRQVIAESTLEQVLSTRGKSLDSFMGVQIQNEISKNLEMYEAGLDVQGVEILSVVPPQQVKEAFNDAIQAQEDEIRYQNEADAYVSKVVPIAEGKAARVIQEANAYAAQTVLAAEGSVARFLAILPEYKRAPDVTRNRLYISTMENTLKNTPKIMVDAKSNNVLVLPLDKFNFNKVLGNDKEKSTQTSNIVGDISNNAYKPTAGQPVVNPPARQPQSNRTWRE